MSTTLVEQENNPDKRNIMIKKFFIGCFKNFLKYNLKSIYNNATNLNSIFSFAIYLLFFLS